jgi:hypothetical protein
MLLSLACEFFLWLEATQKTKEYFSHNWKKIVDIAQLVSLYCIIETLHLPHPTHGVGGTHDSLHDHVASGCEWLGVCFILAITILGRSILKSKMPTRASIFFFEMLHHFVEDRFCLLTCRLDVMPLKNTKDIDAKNSSSSELSVITNHVGRPLFDCQILGRVVVVVTMVFLTILCDKS